MTLKQIGYTKQDGSIGEYVGTIVEQDAAKMLVELYGKFDTLKDGTKKQTYRTLMKDRVVSIDDINIQVG